MALGTITEVSAGFGRSGLVSSVWAPSRWPAAEAMMVQVLLLAVLGSWADTVTMVTTPTPQEAGKLDGPSHGEGPRRLFPGGLGTEALSRCGSKASLGRVTGDPAPDKGGTGSGGELLGCHCKSSFLAKVDNFCLLGASSSSDGTSPEE